MPKPRLANQWPKPGELTSNCTLQYAVAAADSMGGTTSTSWVEFANNPWWSRVTIQPVIPNQTEAVLLYDVEGWYRIDLIQRFLSGLPLRVVAPMNGVSAILTVLQVENPLLANRTLIAHCAAVTA